jgi:hypothetical protein
MTAFILMGDLLDQEGYLVQQCNCVTIKAHGLSQAFIDKFGSVADLYGKRQKRTANSALDPSIPGTYQVVPLNDNQIMIGLFGQWLPGKPRRWEPAYRYNRSFIDTASARLTYFKNALTKFLSDMDDDTPIYFPYRIGCGLAGGDWAEYEKAIQEFASSYQGNTYIVKLEN